MTEKYHSSKSILRSSLQAELKIIYEKLTSEAKIKNNLQLFTEAFISSILIADPEYDQ